MIETEEADPLNTAICKAHTEDGFLWSKIKYHESTENILAPFNKRMRSKSLDFSF